MHFPTKHEPTGGRVYTSFLAQLLRNYLFGSTVAVVGVGGALVFSTLSVPSNERFALGAIMAISLIIMIACELFVFYRHLLPIQAIFKAQQPTSGQLKTAYLHTHKFPVLSVRRTYGPHFLGLLLPAVSMAFFCIKLGFIKLPYFYIGIASAVAFMMGSEAYPTVYRFDAREGQNGRRSLINAIRAIRGKLNLPRMALFFD